MARTRLACTLSFHYKYCIATLICSALLAWSEENMVGYKNVKIYNNWNPCVVCGTVDEPRYATEVWMAGYRSAQKNPVCVKCYSED